MHSEFGLRVFLQPQERGLGAAVSVAGYRVAMLVSGGLALKFFEYRDLGRSRNDQREADI